MGQRGMAESPRGTPRRAVAGGPDGLLATKLYVPPRQTGFVSRPRLVEYLDEGLARPLILVCAPAGFGKTALLADWSRGSHRSPAWVSLDVEDNDAARFWRHVIAAVDHLRPGIAERVGALLGPPAPRSFNGLVGVLINDLTAAPAEGDDMLLVLDDYHLIESRAVHESVTFLIEHLPPGLHLVLSSRADPPLPLARLRGRGQLAELRAAELRFTSEEAADLLREAVGTELPLPASALSALAERTEGWAVGLQLAAISLRGRPDVDAFIEAFSGSHRYVLDYLTEEVLDRQSEELRTFLLESSLLDRLSGELSDAVTGRTDSQSMLERIERGNLFLVPMDEVRGWWRYHHLFADLLRARLQQDRPDRAVELRRNAAAWSEEHGLADDAVRYALAAGDAAWAARLIERHADGLFLRSEEATLQRWLAALPAELIASRPRLLLARAAFAILDGDLEAADGRLDDAERAFADGGDEPFDPSVGGTASLLANVPATIALWRASLNQFRGDAERTMAFAQQALAEVAEGAAMQRAIARLSMGMAEWLGGQLDEAERTFALLIDGSLAAGQPTVAAWASYQLGQVQRAQGRLDAALGIYQRALEFTAPSGRPALPAAGIGHIGLAEVEYQRDDLDAAERQVTEGIALCRQMTDPKPLAMGLARLAWIRQAKRDPSGALEVMLEAAEVAPGAEVTDLLNPVPAGWARLQLVQGDVEAAARWTTERRLGANDELSYPQESAYLVLARVLLAQDLPEDASELLDRLLTSAASQHRVGSLIEINILLALARSARGDEPSALDAVAEAVTLANDQDWLRVFVDEGAPMAALLGRLVAKRGRDLAASGVSLGYLSRLGAAIRPEATSPGDRLAASRTPVIPGLIEALSQRELEVLRLLAAGKANREIAAELFVTIDTVKKHITHIFEKIGTTNRTEAAARARELGLLS
jgi:LuxR family maltose regulon positive regulatory protein